MPTKYTQRLLKDLKNPYIGGAEKVVIQYQLGWVSRANAKKLYRKFKDAENRLFNLALLSAHVGKVEENAR